MQNRLQSFHVLAGEQLCRRHHHGLLAVFCSQITQGSSYHGLAGADVALYQAAERLSLCNIHRARFNGSLLCTGQRERQNTVKFPQAQIAQMCPFFVGSADTQKLHAAGKQKQFFKCHALARLLCLFEGLRAVHAVQGLPQWRELLLLSNCLRKKIRIVFRQSSQSRICDFIKIRLM